MSLIKLIKALREHVQGELTVSQGGVVGLVLGGQWSRPPHLENRVDLHVEKYTK